MSAQNDLAMDCSNYINDNKYNTRKTKSSALRELRHVLKPVINFLKKGCKSNTYKKSPQPDYHDDEVEQNNINEQLEERIFAEIDECEDLAAVPVYSRNGMEIMPVFRGQRHIPVHFARTENGTFFWTSITMADSDICFADKYDTEFQTAEVQVPCDRWVQA